jgi:hypothetical protein
MTHAQDEAEAAKWIDPLIGKLSAVPGTRCAVCRQGVCSHSDAEYAGIIRDAQSAHETGTK